MKWTEDQQKAIEIRDDNMLVSAAAGSGKTALLIERIRRMVVEEGVDVRSLLVLTFTRAAAGEMKERLHRALVKELEKPEAQVKAILDQLHALASADISTMHGFCGSLLRDYFQEAGIDPAFKMGNETELAIMVQESLEAVFETNYLAVPPGEDTPFSTLVEMFTGNRDDGDLKNLVETFHRFTMTLADPAGWCEEALARFDLDVAGFWSSPWGEALIQNTASDLAAAVGILEKALEMVEGSELLVKVEEQLREDHGAIVLASKKLREGYAPFYEALAAIPFARYKGCKADKETSDIIKNMRSEARDIIKGVREKFSGSVEDALADIKAMKAPMETLIALTRQFEEVYGQKKEAKGLLDFNDLEHFTLALLQNPQVAKEVQERYRYVFLDEYQDTNAMQETIIQKIVRRDNYFMVGDVKQSIYRFRLADPGIFIEKYHAFSREAQGEGTLVTLSKNFRSSQAVVDSVNHVFKAIMSENLGEVAYDERAQLYKGLPAQGPYRHTKIHLLETKAEEDEAAATTDPVELEARFIAGEIKARVGKPIFITKTGESRRLTYSDIGVLMRAVTGRGEVFAQVFAQEGIPTYFEGGDTYYESLEITVILNLLRIIDNPHQDIPLLGVMLSPIGGFTPKEAAQIRARVETEYFYQGVMDYAQNGEDELAVRLTAFLGTLNQWSFDAKVMAVEDFIWRLYTQTGYYLFVGTLSGGDQRQSNLRMLLKRAGDYKNATLKGVFHFIRFIERMKKHQFDTSPPGILGENDDVVRITTIHKSKGLEFPVVFVAGMGRQFNTRLGSGRVLFHRVLGICPDYINPEKRMMAPTLAKSICTDQMRMENLSEEMRLLYVAMTRAMEELILVGGVKDVEKAVERWNNPADLYHLKKAKGFLDWVMLALNSQSLGGLPPVDKEVCTVEMADCLVAIHPFNTLEEGQKTAQPTQVDMTQMVVDPETAKDITRRLAWQYPGEGMAEPPEKMSVTQIKRGGVPLAPERLSRPAFMEAGESQYSSTELGTGIHAVLLALDLDRINRCKDPGAVREAVAAQADAMVAEERMVGGLRDALDLAPLGEFFASSLGKRLLAARVVKRELPFNYRIPAGEVDEQWAQSKKTITLQGMIDCCFMEEDHWVLLDYKTDRYHGTGPKKALIAAYKSQLMLYKRALEAITDIPVMECTLVFLTMGETITF